MSNQMDQKQLQKLREFNAALSAVPNSIPVLLHQQNIVRLAVFSSSLCSEFSRCSFLFLWKMKLLLESRISLLNLFVFLLSKYHFFSSSCPAFHPLFLWFFLHPQIEGRLGQVVIGNHASPSRKRFGIRSLALLELLQGTGAFFHAQVPAVSMGVSEDERSGRGGRSCY